VTRYGFEVFGYRGLETGDREYVSWAIRQNRIVFVLVSPLNPGETIVNEHIAKHGDGVRDVAFTVDDTRGIFAVCRDR
jgi:4-hydroxyphenylpyruvate dioxygenase